MIAKFNLRFIKRVAAAIAITISVMLSISLFGNLGAFLSWTHFISAPDESQKILVIMTQTRSGSTFTGEIFAATSNSMYIYEPLYPFGVDCRFRSDRVTLLKKLLRCDFTNLKEIYSHGFQLTQSRDHSKCLENGLCFSPRGTTLLNNYAKACTNVSQAFDPKSKTCGYPLRSDILKYVCDSSKLLITKVNRICTLEEMESVYKYLTSLGKRVYVLHMLRDVRSITSSKIKLEGVKHARRIANNVIITRCPRQRNNVVLNDTSSDFTMMADGHYLRIRYEDLAINAIGQARRVFRFMGRSLPVEVVSNIVNFLHPNETVMQQLEGNGKSSGKEIKTLSHQYKSPFGVVRDPIKILNEWRNLVPFEQVRRIQDKCGDVLTKMGYKSFATEEEMKDLSIPSFKHSSP